MAGSGPLSSLPGAAPAWLGEGAHALWHFSEQGDIDAFVPRVTPTNPERGRWVWAVDTRHSPLFWFPRDCPRATAWSTVSTSRADLERFFDVPADGVADADTLRPVRRIHVMEQAWLERMRACALFAYRMPADMFIADPLVHGYWLASEPVRPLEVTPVGDLLARHAAAGIELRVVTSIWPWWAQVVRSTLGFSGARLRYCGWPQPAWVLP